MWLLPLAVLLAANERLAALSEAFRAPVSEDRIDFVMLLWFAKYLRIGHFGRGAARDWGEKSTGQLCPLLDSWSREGGMASIWVQPGEGLALDHWCQIALNRCPKKPQLEGDDKVQTRCLKDPLRTAPGPLATRGRPWISVQTDTVRLPAPKESVRGPSGLTLILVSGPQPLPPPPDDLPCQARKVSHTQSLFRWVENDELRCPA